MELIFGLDTKHVFTVHNEFDKIYTRFCKSVLGVHSRTSNTLRYIVSLDNTFDDFNNK